MAERGVSFVNVSPVRHDMDAVPTARWLPLRPGKRHCLDAGVVSRPDRGASLRSGFRSTRTTGFGRFKAYVLGESDGCAKTPEWAAALTEIGSSDDHRSRAAKWPAARTMINVAWSVQRAVQGEQMYWGAVALAALLGQIGTEAAASVSATPASTASARGRNGFSGPRLPQGSNPVKTYIPVACVADMLLYPGEEHEYNGEAPAPIRTSDWSIGRAATCSTTIRTSTG